MKAMPKLLSVAGSDSGGGAGIQADVRAGTMLGCHVSTAVTAITAQNSLGVQSATALAPEAVAEQMESVLSDIGADAVKTGMLANAGITSAVARTLQKYGVRNIVVDPVMVAKGGASLLDASAERALAEELLPLALLVTPNVPEASALAGFPVTDRESMVAAGRKILEFGPKAALIKGGHLDGRTVTDVLVTSGGEVVEWSSPRFSTPHTHGTGCTLSAAIASELAKGAGLVEAVGSARAFLARAIANAYATGAGHGSTNPRAALGSEGEVIERLYRAWEILDGANPFGLIPEVQSNLAEALPGAVSFAGVAAFPGRIIKAGNKIARVEGPRFGATRHMAKILLASARAGSPFRAVMNVRYGLDVLAACRACGFSVAGFSRYDEPPEVKAAEGSTLEWGTGKVLDELSTAPDAIYDEGDVGKEPMVRIFGVDAEDAARKVVAIWDHLNGGN